MRTFSRDSRRFWRKGHDQRFPCVLEITALVRDDVCLEVGDCLEAPRCGGHSVRLGKFYARQRFVFRMFVDFRSSQYVI